MWIWCVCLSDASTHLSVCVCLSVSFLSVCFFLDSIHPHVSIQGFTVLIFTHQHYYISVTSMSVSVNQSNEGRESHKCNYVEMLKSKALTADQWSFVLKNIQMVSHTQRYAHKYYVRQYKLKILGTHLPLCVYAQVSPCKHAPKWMQVWACVCACFCCHNMHSNASIKPVQMDELKRNSLIIA